MQGREFSSGEYCKIKWPGDYIVATSFGPQNGPLSYTTVLDYCDVCGVVFSFRNRDKKRKYKGGTIIQIAGPMGSVLEFYRHLRSIVGSVRGNLTGIPTVREVNVFEIRDSRIAGPIVDIKEACEAEKVPCDEHFKVGDEWTDGFEVDWGETESETDVEENIDQLSVEDSDSGDDGPREVAEAKPSLGEAASSSSLGEAGPTKVDGVFQMHNFLFSEDHFDPGLQYDQLAFNVLFYRAARWLEDESPFQADTLASMQAIICILIQQTLQTTLEPLCSTRCFLNAAHSEHCGASIASFA